MDGFDPAKSLKILDLEVSVCLAINYEVIQQSYFVFIL
jgi:hypothetical protein